MAMCCMLTEGHLLLDDVPGTGKTTLAKAIAGSIAGSWKRVQFTPDLLPSDITGVMVYEQSTGTFRFREGSGVHQRADRRRDQPRQPEDAVGAARGDGGAPGHRRRRLAPGAAAVLRHRHPEPQGLPGHVHACPTCNSTGSRCASASGYTDHNTEVRLLEEYNRHQRDESVSPVTDATQLEQVIDAVDRIVVSHSVHDYIVRLANGDPRPPRPAARRVDPRHDLADAHRPRVGRHRRARLRDTRRRAGRGDRRVRPPHWL